ncbi:17538_t:CDS:2, partial [Racocetra persica]
MAVNVNKFLKNYVYLDEEDCESELALYISYVLGNAILWYCNVISKSEDMMHMPIDLLIANMLELFKECLGTYLGVYTQEIMNIFKL